MATGTNSIAEWWLMLREWVRGGDYADADIIRQYESRFAEICDVRHAVSFGAGRMALYAILEALDIGPGDEVIIPAFTCVVVPNAILYRGAVPIYVDIEPRSFNIDVSKIDAAITPRTKALYAQHTFGVPCDIAALREIAVRHRLPIIEDAAHALGAKYRGRPVGSLTEVAFFSTDRSKVINTHLGGVVTTSDPDLAGRIRAIQTKSRFLDAATTRRLIATFLVEYVCFAPKILWIGRIAYGLLARAGMLFYFSDEMRTSIPDKYPFPCSLSSAQAKLGLSQLDRLSTNIRHRRSIADWLESRVRWYGYSIQDAGEGAWLRYSFMVRDRARFEKAFSRRFDLGIWFTSVVSGRQDNLQEVKYHAGSCPVAEFAADHVVNFPTHCRIPLEFIQGDMVRNWAWLEGEIEYGRTGSGPVK